MTLTLSKNSIEMISQMLTDLEASIARYPQDLREIYTQGIAGLAWAKDNFGDEASDFSGLCNRDLAMAHRLMFASAFAASAVSLPGRGIDEVPVESTSILDVVTDAGLPPREFLCHYGKYGNQFTWKLLKLTGRISGSSI